MLTGAAFGISILSALLYAFFPTGIWGFISVPIGFQLYFLYKEMHGCVGSPVPSRNVYLPPTLVPAAGSLQFFI